MKGKEKLGTWQQVLDKEAGWEGKGKLKRLTKKGKINLKKEKRKREEKKEEKRDEKASSARISASVQQISGDPVESVQLMIRPGSGGTTWA